MSVCARQRFDLLCGIGSRPIAARLTMANLAAGRREKANLSHALRLLGSWRMTRYAAGYGR